MAGLIMSDDDLPGIASLMRRHIEIRNRSWLKRIHRDSFLGSEAVDFLVAQGFAESRQAAVELGLRMAARKLIKNVSSSKKFSDSVHFYRFMEDDQDYAVLDTFNAGNGNIVAMGLGGCKWSFAPHTAHNSYVLDIGLAEEIERAVAGASVESRAAAINKLRSRVREQAEVDAANWELTQSTMVNNTQVNVYHRTRPRGDWKNTKMTGIVPESPAGFIRSIVSFEKRRQWESAFEDGVIVEGIDTGEKPSELLLDGSEVTEAADTKGKKSGKEARASSPTPPTAPATSAVPAQPIEVAAKQQPAKVVRAVDDVYAFLQTVDLAGIPHGMAIAFLNDPERQHALAYLRKQMMLSNPQECMLCQTNFDTNMDIRFCPCCAMVCCAGCISKRVFEVVSRNVMSVCVHCYRESSRVFHPPQALQQTNDETLRGKWWRPEELGLTDYSLNNAAPAEASSATSKASSTQAATASLYNDEDDLLSNDAQIRPLIPGLLDEDNDAKEEDDRESEETTKASEQSTQPPAASAALAVNNPNNNNKTARCKNCGMLISRDIEAIEAHMEECTRPSSPMAPNPPGKKYSIYGRPSTMSMDNKTYTLNPDGSGISILHGNHKQFAGIPRRPELAKQYNTRIIYRTARSANANHGREVCALQDCFMESDGSAYMYEISVRHSEVRGIPDYITADVMLLMHVARPIKGAKNTSQISIIHQVDVHSKTGVFTWFSTSNPTAVDIAGVRKEDLVRELKMCADLPNLLNGSGEDEEESKVCLDDFELLAVLGRGGFGKVMQVRHKQTGEIYAMKILKKSELRRRRQVERTQTERTILANVRHPFIVSLHYAFQNQQKLYMVMDFVQGGDFFTLMRKFRHLPEEWVRFYVLQVAMALQHLHDREIVYRDLKPENILLCADGYLKLTDFGLSRYFETRPPNPEDIVDLEKDDFVTRSFCGTEQYMSPEMLLQQGHNYRMDWWCLGLLMHEMIAGSHPFHGRTHYDTLRNMVTKAPTIDLRLSQPAAAIVKAFLIKNPRSRLGARAGLEELRPIPYFTAVNWDDLYEKKIQMPYRPKVCDESDISSFETTFTREKPIDSIVNDQSKNGDNDAKAKKNKGGGLLGMFGYTNQANSPMVDENMNNDAFKGFSFTKDDVVDGTREQENPGR